MTPENIALLSAIVAIASAAAAWSALFVQRRNATDTINAQVNIGARNSRASVVSANRQKWIDSIRDDVADFIATRSQLEGLKRAGSFQRAGQDALLTEERLLQKHLLMLRVRVELRINHKEQPHLGLLGALDRYDTEYSADADRDLRLRAGAIFKEEWERLKREAAGTDPFVRELPASAPQQKSRMSSEHE
jgi:hypothetical protein